MLETLRWGLYHAERCPFLLVGFSGEKVYLEGSIELPLSLGEGKKVVTMVKEFVVVDDP